MNSLESFKRDYLYKFNLDIDLNSDIYCKETIILNTLFQTKFYNILRLLKMIYKKNKTTDMELCVNEKRNWYMTKHASLEGAVDIINKTEVSIVSFIDTLDKK